MGERHARVSVVCSDRYGCGVDLCARSWWGNGESAEMPR